jgi:TetR/AcrR family transcriptional regulator, transcriptional repressor for nem operon
MSNQNHWLEDIVADLKIETQKNLHSPGSFFRDIKQSSATILIFVDIKYTDRYILSMKKTAPNKAERTRQFIIEKAAPVFNKKGIAGTSLSDLTKATGLTKGSIYGNFKDKDEVAIYVFQYNVDNLISYLTQAIDCKDTFVGKLLAIPRAYRKLYNTMIDYGGCPILNTAAEADDTHQVLCRMAVDAIETMKKNITRLIQSGKKSGELHSGADTDKIAEVIICLIEGGSLLSKATGKDTFMMNSLEQIERLISEATSDA